MKPEPKAKVTAEGVKLSAKKGGTDGFNIYKDSGSGSQLLKTVSGKSYIDASPLPANVNTVIWTYVFIYVIGDKEVGQPSDPMPVTVTRKV